jgi:hypothetical protein
MRGCAGILLQLGSQDSNLILGIQSPPCSPVTPLPTALGSMLC